MNYQSKWHDAHNLKNIILYFVSLRIAVLLRFSSSGVNLTASLASVCEFVRPESACLCKAEMLYTEGLKFA